MQFVGANDPGSSVGTLLEIGRVLGASQQKPKLLIGLSFSMVKNPFAKAGNNAGSRTPQTTPTAAAVMLLNCATAMNSPRSRMILLDMMGYKNSSWDVTT